MAGSRETGLKAAETNKERHGADFYERIGRKGGKARSTRFGFRKSVTDAEPESRPGS